MQITLKEIQQKFEELPENLKWAIMTTNIDEHITIIGQRHGLNLEQLGQLSLETHMVVLGYTTPNNFENSLKESLDLPDEKNKEIIDEINEEILGKIRENLRSLDENKNEESSDLKQEELPENSESDYKKDTYEDKEKIGESKKIMESIAFKKLSNSFNSPVKKTEHSLDNISKKEEKDKLTANQDTKIIDDPYRMKPE
jgi:hypothetical protein